MLEPYKDTNEKLMAAVQELTTKLCALEMKVNEGGGGGSSDIPDPTIADAGKVLGVDDEGKWELQESGGGVVTLNTIYDSTTDDWYIDVNYNTLKSYIESGTPVVLINSDTNGEMEVTASDILISITHITNTLSQENIYMADFGTGTQVVATSPTDPMYHAK